MILRSVALRHGRKVLAAPLSAPSLRSLTTETLSQETSAIENSIKNHENETHSIEANINQLRSTEAFVPPSAAGEPSPEVLENFNLLRSIRKRTNKLGSVVAPHYKPHELVSNPVRPKDVTLELLLASQAHLGHSTSIWNPANQRYIYGIRQGIHIFSLEVIAAHLRRAAKIVEGVAYHGGIILFVGTRRGQAPAVVKAAEIAKGYHLFDKWTPGSITNSEKILANCGMKAVDKDDQLVDGFDEILKDPKALEPDLVVVMNPLENYTLLHECGLRNIPTIGVIDTNADPTWVTYPIPANDDSLRCIQLIAGVLGRAGEEGQRLRLEAAKSGKVTWKTSSYLKRSLEELEKEKSKDADEASASTYKDEDPKQQGLERSQPKEADLVDSHDL